MVTGEETPAGGAILTWYLKFSPAPKRKGKKPFLLRDEK